MDIEFDPAKDAANREKHGLSLAEAADLDLLTCAIVEDDRYDYGELRWRAFGWVEGRGVCLVFTLTDQFVVRPISFRRAGDKELQRHGL